MAASQGARSTSVSAMPLCIFSLFAAEWKSSASTNSNPRRFASKLPMVVLPEPVGPTTTMIIRLLSPYLRLLDRLPSLCRERILGVAWHSPSDCPPRKQRCRRPRSPHQPVQRLPPCHGERRHPLQSETADG